MSARRIVFDVVDVDDAISRVIQRLISTSPEPAEYALGRVRLISPELARLIEPLYLSASRITIWDRDFQLRAETGTVVPDDYKTYLASDIQAVGWKDSPQEIQRIADRILRSPLIDPDEYPEDSSREDQRLLKNIFETGTSIAERRRYGNARIIAAGHPVWLEDEVIGSIIIKQSGNKILITTVGCATAFHFVVSRGISIFDTYNSTVCVPPDLSSDPLAARNRACCHAGWTFAQNLYPTRNTLC